MKPTYEQLFSQNQTLIQQVETLTVQLQEALAEIKLLRAEVKDLKDKLNTNSSNSSKPPSQDPYRSTKKKKPTGRKQGGQPGHTGYKRSLYPVAEVQIVHDLRPQKCPNCQSHDLKDK